MNRSINQNGKNSGMNFGELIQAIEEQNINTKFGFYDIYLEFDTKYRDRSNPSTENSEFKFRISGRKDLSTGTKNGIIGLSEPIRNLVQLEVGDIIMPNILKIPYTPNRVCMVINELLGNEVTTKSTTNLLNNTDTHFVFDVMPIYNIPLPGSSSDNLTIDNKYIRLVAVVRSLLFKAPTTETLDQLTISFYANNEKIVFPTDEYKCEIKLGPNTLNEVIFPSDHDLNVGDVFEIYANEKTEEYIKITKDNSVFTEYELNGIKSLDPYEINGDRLLRLYNPVKNNDYIEFEPEYISYKNILVNDFNVNFIKNNKSANFLINDSYYLIDPNVKDKNKELVSYVKKSIEELDVYIKVSDELTRVNLNIMNQINNLDTSINRSTHELKKTIERAFALKSYNGKINLTYKLTLNDNQIYVNGDITKTSELYTGNEYVYNQSDNSNMNKNGAANIITKKDIEITIGWKDAKIMINSSPLDDYNLLQNGIYSINMNDIKLKDKSLLLLPSDTLGKTDELDKNNVIVEYQIDIKSEYESNFVFPIAYYIDSILKPDDGLHNFDYNEYISVNKYYLKLDGNGSENNSSTAPKQSFNVTVPKRSFHDTVYEMPYQRHRGYNFDYGVTSNVDAHNKLATEKRDSIVDIGLSPYNDIAASVLTLKSIKWGISGLNHSTVNNTANYKSFDDIVLYNDKLTYDEGSLNNVKTNELRQVPYRSENPHVALKWGHVYKFDYSALISNDIRYVILELIDVEGIFKKNVNTKTLGHYLVEPGSNVDTPMSDPSVEKPDTSHVVYTSDGIKNYFKVDLYAHDILYIDLRELLHKNTKKKDVTPTTYDKKHFFGRTFKMYYENKAGIKYDLKYSIIKMGSLINVNSYYFNYAIKEKNDKLKRLYKIEFRPYTYNMKLYYEPSTKTRTISYKIIKEKEHDKWKPVLYTVQINPTSFAIKYIKVNESEIIIKSGDKILLDLNHHSNNNTVFKMKLKTSNALALNNSDTFIPPLSLFGDMIYISNYNTDNDIYDVTSKTYGFVNDVYNASNEEYIIQDTVVIPITLQTPITPDFALKINDTVAPTVYLPFGRKYKINCNALMTVENFNKKNYDIVLKLNNDIYDINNQSKTTDNISSITGVIYNKNEGIHKYIEFKTDDRDRSNNITIEFGSDGVEYYFQFDLRNDLFTLNYSQLNFKIFIRDKVRNIKYNNTNININVVNYQNTINLTNVQDELSRSLEYNDTLNPLLELLYTDVDQNYVPNNVFKFQKKSYRQELHTSNSDNYNDYVFLSLTNSGALIEAKNVFKLHSSENLSVSKTWDASTSSFKLQKMTGNNRVRFEDFNLYSSSIDLWYSYNYYIDFTEYASYLYKNYRTEYDLMLISNNAVIELYVDMDLCNIYVDVNVATSEKYNADADMYKYFGIDSPPIIVKYKLNINKITPNKLYYGISYTKNNQKITIKGGEINVHKINIAYAETNAIGTEELANNTITYYNNQETANTAMYYLYIDNLYDNNDSHILHQINEYQDSVEVYFKAPRLNDCNYYLNKYENHKDVLYGLTYNSLQNKILTLGDALYNDIKGISNTYIQVISTLIDKVTLSAGVTLIESNTRYSKTDVYLISDTIYTFNLDDVSNSILTITNPELMGYFVIESANRAINIKNIITVHDASTYVITNYKLKFMRNEINEDPLINIFYLNFTEFVAKSGEYLSYYYENHPNQKGRIYMSGKKEWNITTRVKKQDDIIRKINISRTSNVNLFDVYEQQKVTENVSNVLLKIEKREYSTKLLNLKKEYEERENEIIKNNDVVAKYKNKISSNIEILASLKSNVLCDKLGVYKKNNSVLTLHDLINDNYFLSNNYVVVFDTYLRKSPDNEYYLHVDNRPYCRFNNSFVSTPDIQLYKDNLYVFNLNDFVEPVRLKVYKKRIDENSIYYIELPTTAPNECVYINKVNTLNGKVVNTVSLFIPFNSKITEIYYGVSDMHDTVNPTYKTLISRFGRINVSDTEQELKALRNTKYTVNENNNSFVLEERYNSIKKYTMISLTKGICSKDGLIENITDAMNKYGRHKYEVRNSNELDKKLQIKIKTNHIIIYVDYNYHINTIDTNSGNYLNKALNGNEALCIGNRYIFDYALLKTRPSHTFNIYSNKTRTKIYKSPDCYNDTLNNKLHIEITDTTPDILYYGNNIDNILYGKEIYIQTYDNTINVKYGDNKYLLKCHYKYDETNDINIPVYLQIDLLRKMVNTNIPGYHIDSNFALKLNEYYTFDYSHVSVLRNYQFNLYTDESLTVIYDNVNNDIINRRLRVYISDQLKNNNLYFGGVIDGGTTANDITIRGGKIESTYDYPLNDGFRIRFDMPDIYSDLYLNQNKDFYNSVRSDYTTLTAFDTALSAIIIKRHVQVICSREFISQANIVNKETDYVVYLYVINPALYAVVRKYDPVTKEYNFINSCVTIINNSLPSSVRIIYLTRLNDSYYDKNDYLQTVQRIYSSMYLISYDDDEKTYYHVFNVYIDFDSVVKVTVNLLNVDGIGVKVKTTKDCRVSNKNLDNNQEPRSIDDVSAPNSVNVAHKRYVFAIVFDLDKCYGQPFHSFRYLYYDVVESNIVFNTHYLNINLILSNIITEPNLLLYSNDTVNINNLTFEGVSSIIDVNNTELVYTVRYKSNYNYRSSYIIPIKIVRTDVSTTNWVIVCHAATGVYKYSSINGNCANFCINSNAFIWTGQKRVNGDNNTNLPLDTVFKIYESTGNKLIQKYPNPKLFLHDVDNEDKSLFSYVDNNNINTIPNDVIYGSFIPGSTKILLIQCHSNKRVSFEYQSFINVKILDINTNNTNEYYTIKTINNGTRIDDRNFINDNTGSTIDVINRKASNTLYDTLYGYKLYPTSIFMLTNYNLYTFYISPSFSVTDSANYNMISYNFVESVLETDNIAPSLNKTFLGVSPYNTVPSSYNYSRVWTSDYNILKSSKHSIDNLIVDYNELKEIILKLTADNECDYNEYNYYKMKTNHLINERDQIGYSKSTQPAYKHYYGDLTSLTNLISSQMTTSNVDKDGYISKQEGIATIDALDKQLIDAERLHKVYITDLIVFTNSLKSYNTALSTLLDDIKNFNQFTNPANIAYYANNYILTNNTASALDALITEKNNAIDMYVNDSTTAKLAYYNNLSKLSVNGALISSKMTIINDGVIALSLNSYNEHNSSGATTASSVYLQNILMKNKSVYIKGRRFKIPMTMRIVVKDRLTNYLKI